MYILDFHEASTLENSLLSPNELMSDVEPFPVICNQEITLDHDFQNLAVPGTSTSTLQTPIKRHGSPQDVHRSLKQRRSGNFITYYTFCFRISIFYFSFTLNLIADIKKKNTFLALGKCKSI